MRPIRCVLLALLAAMILPAPAAAVPVGSHAMVYACCTSPAQLEAAFADSRAMGASFIRVDVGLDSVFGGAEPDWSGVDRVMRLSRAHGVPVLGILLGTPSHLSRCPE